MHPDVAVDRALKDWLDKLQSALGSTHVRVSTRPDDALVWITDRTDSVTVRNLLHAQPSLVIIGIGHIDGNLRHDHERLVDAVNAGAAAYLVDPSVALLVVHIRCAGLQSTARRRRTGC